MSSFRDDHKWTEICFSISWLSRDHSEAVETLLIPVIIHYSCILKKTFLFYSSYWFLLCYVWKISSSSLINDLTVKDIEHSLSIANICVCSFTLKLFNTSLQCTKNNFKSVAEKKLASVGRDKMPGLGCWIQERNDLAVWKITKQIQIGQESELFFVWDVSGFSRGKKLFKTGFLVFNIKTKKISLGRTGK